MVVVLLAVVAPVLTSRIKRVRIPSVVGEIIAGIIVGQSVLGLVTGDEILDILALLGFAYLMFLSGLEVDFEALLPRQVLTNGSWKNRLSNPFMLGVLTFILTLFLGLAAAWGLNALDAADDPWLMALILSTTSLGLVAPVLKERDMTGHKYGQALLISAVIADFATMLLVSIYVLLRTEGLSAEVMLFLLLFGAFATAYRLARVARRRLPISGLMDGIAQATTQINVRGAFAIALIFIALAQGLGVEIILGAFLGGALISLLSDRHASDLHHHLDVIGYAFFIPIFFIMVGANFDLNALLESPESLLLVPVILALAFVIKFLALLAFRLGFDWRHTIAAGSLMSSRLSLIIAVAAIGLNLGSIDSATNAAIILVAIVTSTVSPLLFNRILPAQPIVKFKYVVVGAGKSPRLLAQRIQGHGQDVVVLDLDPDRRQKVEAMGLKFEEGDAMDHEVWKDLEPETIQAVAIMLADDALSLQVANLIRDGLGIDRVVARVHDATLSHEFVNLGVEVVNPSLSPIVELEYLLLYPSVSSLIGDLDDDQEVMEVRLGCPDYTDKPLRELDLPAGSMVVLVRRNGDVIYPRGETQLKIGDQLTLMGEIDSVHQLARACE